MKIEMNYLLIVSRTHLYPISFRLKANKRCERETEEREKYPEFGHLFMTI